MSTVLKIMAIAKYRTMGTLESLLVPNVSVKIILKNTITKPEKAVPIVNLETMFLDK
jgi:hypothetical protein